MHQLSLNALGTPITLSFHGLNDQQFENLVSIWSRLIADSEGAGAKVFLDVKLVPVDDPRPFHYSSFNELTADLSSVVTGFAIENCDPDWMLFHAAAVAHPVTGEVVAFVGPSGAGKTTLAKTLGVNWVYVTDETLAVNLETGAVMPYPKPLSVLSQLPGKVQLGPDALGLKATEGGLRLAALFVLNRDSSSNAPNPVSVATLDSVEAVELLLPQVSHLSRQREPIRQLLLAATWGAGLNRITYRESNEIPTLVEQFFESSELVETPKLDSWREIVRQSPNSVPTAGAGESIQTLDFQHAMRSTEITLVFCKEKLFALQGIGADIFELANGGIEFQELVQALVARQGIPSTGLPAELVSGAIESLRNAGLVA